MPERGSAVRAELAAVSILILSLALLAGSRNLSWRSDLLLWNDNVAKSPLKARPHYNLGVILLEADRVGEARSQYLEALRLNPRYTEAYINLGKVYVRQGEHSRAREAFRAAVLLDPESVLAHFNLGVAYLDEAMNDEAAREFETVLQVRPDYAPARQFLDYLGKEKRDGHGFAHE